MVNVRSPSAFICVGTVPVVTDVSGEWRTTLCPCASGILSCRFFELRHQTTLIGPERHVVVDDVQREMLVVRITPGVDAQPQ